MVGGSYNGITVVSKTTYEGSTPSPPAKTFFIELPGWIVEFVVPDLDAKLDGRCFIPIQKYGHRWSYFCLKIYYNI